MPTKVKKILRNDIVNRICDTTIANPNLSKSDNLALTKKIIMQFIQEMNQELINGNMLDIAQLGKFEVKEQKRFNTKFVKFSPASSLAKGLKEASNINEEELKKQREIIRKNLQNYNVKETALKNRKFDDIKDSLFNIDDFPKLFDELSKNENIKNKYISDKIKFETKPDSNGNIPKLYYIYDEIRSFIYGSFLFNNKKIGFIEIQASSTWRDISTWFFIFNDPKEIFNEDRVNDIVFEYISSDKKLKDMEELFLNQNIIFFRKVHPNITTKLSSKDMSNWSNLLIKSLIKKIN